MKNYKENVSGLISEDELMDLAGGATGEDPTPVASVSEVLSVIVGTISIATQIVCPSSACTSSGYCE